MFKNNKCTHESLKKKHLDILFTIGILLLTTCINFFFRKLSDTLTIASLYVLAVAIIARITEGYFIGFASCFFIVLCDNYFFTKPYNSLNFNQPTYPLSFLSMLLISIIICYMTSQLKEKEKLIVETKTEIMRNKLLLAISHDIRTPLTSILGASSAILDNFDMITQERRIELLREVKEEADWLIHMVENILYITKVQGRDTKLNTHLEIVEEILFDATNKVKKRYPDAPINIQYKEEIVMVPMDAILIEQVLINLMENSIIHGENVTSIDISIEVGTKTVTFIVKDNGVGIKKEVLPHLFNGLSRTMVKGSIDSTKNCGIGLSVCKAIIDAHNGTIEASNNIEGGACFAFELPLEEDSYEQ